MRNYLKKCNHCKKTKGYSAFPKGSAKCRECRNMFVRARMLTVKHTKKCNICDQTLFLSCFPKQGKACKACRAAKYRGLHKHQCPKKSDRIKQLEAWINTPPLRYFPDTGER